MRKFKDYHVTKWVFDQTSMSGGSNLPGILSTTTINCAGYGRARFVFSLGLPTAGATFSSGVIMEATGSAAAYQQITALPSISAASMAVGGLMVVDVALGNRTNGGSNTWLIVSSASRCVGSWQVHGIVDLYNCYIHPPVADTVNTPSVVITV
jgi:hypothetical protein